MLAFRQGDAQAFGVLVQRHRGPVFNFILRFAGQRARAEDLTQETWLRVIRHASAYQHHAKFTTWLYTLARNLCVDSARKESYRRTDSLEASQGPGDTGARLSETLPDTESISPERGAQSAELRPLLEKALLELPEEQREVFLLREYSGIPFKEIAEVTGTAENTVKSRMRYALEGLRRKLSAAGVGVDEPSDQSVAG